MTTSRRPAFLALVVSLLMVVPMALLSGIAGASTTPPGVSVCKYDGLNASRSDALSGAEPGTVRACGPSAKLVVVGGASDGRRNDPLRPTPRFATNSAGTPKAPSTVTQTETYAPSPMKPSAATGAWDDFLGSGQTNINPRTGLADPNRIFSADGTRSIRFGPHEMNSSPTKFHFHQETWTFDPVTNTWHVDNVVQRVPLKK